jgi:hypothetical protein
MKELFDSPGKTLLLDREPPEPPRRRRRADIEAQEERIRVLNAEGHVAVVGKCGATVFKARYGQ